MSVGASIIIVFLFGAVGEERLESALLVYASVRVEIVPKVFRVS